MQTEPERKKGQRYGSPKDNKKKKDVKKKLARLAGNLVRNGDLLDYLKGRNLIESSS